jgi:hypothetical protein
MLIKKIRAKWFMNVEEFHNDNNNNNNLSIGFSKGLLNLNTPKFVLLNISLKTLLIKKLWWDFIWMMITYHPHMKKTHNLKIVLLVIFRNSKYNFKIFKL